jgi:hypothetical protein
MSSTDTTTDANLNSGPNQQNTGAVVPPPPRMTGDPATDMYSLVGWMWSFYNATVVETGLLDPTTQATAQTWDPNNLPNPSSTTIATAQQTANLAYQFANLINNSLTSPVTPPTPSS